MWSPRSLYDVFLMLSKYTKLNSINLKKIIEFKNAVKISRKYSSLWISKKKKKSNLLMMLLYSVPIYPGFTFCSIAWYL